jgi:hypothetical protein
MPNPQKELGHGPQVSQQTEQRVGTASTHYPGFQQSKDKLRSEPETLFLALLEERSGLYPTDLVLI